MERGFGLKRAALNEWRQFLLAESHVLQQNPSLLFQQAFNRPISTNPAQVAHSQFESGHERRPFYLLINKPEKNASCLLTLVGHSASIGACAYSPDGSRLISSSGDGVLRLWDAESGKEITAIAGVRHWEIAPTNVFFCTVLNDGTICLWDIRFGTLRIRLVPNKPNTELCSISPDGRRIVTGFHDGSLALWNVSSGGMLNEVRGEDGSAITFSRFSCDGSRVIFATGGSTFLLLDSQTGDELYRISEHGTALSSIDFSPDGNSIAVGCEDAQVRIRDVKSGRLRTVLKGHLQAITDCKFSPDGKRIISGDDGGALWLWAVNDEKGEIFDEGRHRGRIYSCSFLPDGKRIQVTSGIHGYSLWDSHQRRKIIELFGDRHTKGAFAVSPDSALVVFSGESFSTWDAWSGDEIASFEGHDGWVTSCNFSPDGARIISGSSDATVKIWDAKVSRKIADRRGHSQTINFITCSSDRRFFVTAADDRTLKTWNAATGRELATFEGHFKAVKSCSTNPDCTRILSVSADKSVKLWDVEAGREIAIVGYHDDEALCCAISPDGKTFVSGSDDSRLKLWSAITHKEIATLGGPAFDVEQMESTGHLTRVKACSFSPDGKRIVSGSADSSLIVWNAVTGDELARLRGHSGSVNACAFSPDGTKILSASSDGTLKQWDASDFRELKTLVGHKDEVLAVASSLDGSHIISASADKSIRLWDTETGNEVWRIQWSVACTCMAWGPQGNLAIGTEGGRFYLIRFMNIQSLYSNPIVTTSWRQTTRSPIFFGKDESLLAFACPYCSVWSKISDSHIGRILQCPSCDNDVKLNHFTIEADWRPIARTWQESKKKTRSDEWR